MNNGYIEDLRKQVKKALKEDKMRYRHTLGVADTSACLAMRYGVDMQKAYIAGLLHAGWHEVWHRQKAHQNDVP